MAIAFWGGAISFWGGAIAYTGVSYSTNTVTQSNDLSQRVDRTEGQIVDLQMTANLILQAIGKTPPTLPPSSKSAAATVNQFQR